MPDNRWTKFNATRSALRIARAGPDIFNKMSSPLTRWPSLTSRSILISPSEVELYDALIRFEILGVRRARPSD